MWRKLWLLMLYWAQRWWGWTFVCFFRSLFWRCVCENNRFCSWAHICACMQSSESNARYLQLLCTRSAFESASLTEPRICQFVRLSGQQVPGILLTLFPQFQDSECSSPQPALWLTDSYPNSGPKLEQQALYWLNHLPSSPFWNKVSCSQGWPPIRCTTDSGLESLTLLPPKYRSYRHALLRAVMYVYTYVGLGSEDFLGILRMIFAVEISFFYKTVSLNYWRKNTVTKQYDIKTGELQNLI